VRNELSIAASHYLQFFAAFSVGDNVYRGNASAEFTFFVVQLRIFVTLAINRMVNRLIVNQSINRLEL